jgi:hypothetical protein
VRRRTDLWIYFLEIRKEAEEGFGREKEVFHFQIALELEYWFWASRASRT